MTRWAIGSLPDLSLCNSGTDLESGTKKDLVTQDSSSSAQLWTGSSWQVQGWAHLGPRKGRGPQRRVGGKDTKGPNGGGLRAGLLFRFEERKAVPPTPPPPHPDIDLCFDHGGNLHSGGKGFVLLFCFLGT